MNISTVNELITSLESAGELSIKERKYLELAKAYLQLAAENVVRQEFVKICFRAAADGASLDGADIQEIGERLGLFGRETYQPVLHGYICGHEAGEDSVYVMKSSPATDRIVAEAEARGLEKAREIVRACHDNICPGGLAENRQYEEAIVQPHLDGISDELDFEIEQLREGAK